LVKFELDLRHPNSLLSTDWSVVAWAKDGAVRVTHKSGTLSSDHWPVLKDGEGQDGKKEEKKKDDDKEDKEKDDDKEDKKEDDHEEEKKKDEHKEEKEDEDEEEETDDRSMQEKDFASWIESTVAQKS